VRVQSKMARRERGGRKKESHERRSFARDKRGTREGAVSVGGQTRRWGLGVPKPKKRGVGGEGEKLSNSR